MSRIRNLLASGLDGPHRPIQPVVHDRSTRVAALPAREYVVSPPPAPSGWDVVLRRKWTVAAVGLACMGFAIGLSLLQSKSYLARTTLEIQAPNEALSYIREVESNNTQVNPESYLQTQIGILQSRTLTRRAAAKIAPAGRADMADSFEDRLKVHPAGPSRIVEVLYEAPDPHLAANFANTLVNEYIRQTREDRMRASRGTGDWLASQLNDMREQYEKSSAALQAYAVKTGITYTDEKSSADEERLRQVLAELSNAHVDRIAKQSKFETARNGSQESLPEVLDSGPLRDYQAKLTELRRQQAELEALLTPEHYKVKRVRAQIEEVTKAFERERQSVVGRIQNEYEAARRREALLAGAYQRQRATVASRAGETLEYGLLKREVETNRAIYEAMLQKVKEANIAAAMIPTNVRVVDPAEPPRHPHKPNIPLNAALGLFGGLFLGAVLVTARDAADSSVKQPGEVTAILNLPEIGVIPSLPNRGQLARLWNGVGADRNPVVWNAASSVAAESFRAVLASLLFGQHGGAEPRVIVLTSAGGQEGKTLTVANLGIALARVNRRVLLIDGDTRRPRLHRVLGIENGPGFTDLLESGDADAPGFEEYLHPIEFPGLSVMTVGTHSDFAPEAFLSPELARLLARCRAEFDYVLIDTPPVLPAVDARFLARAADGVLLVIRAGKTTREEARTAVRRFSDDLTPVLGSILNDWSTPPGSYYGSYYGRHNGEPGEHTTSAA